MNACHAIPRPSVEHEDRVLMIHDLAILMGYDKELGSLPSWIRPDVFRKNTLSGGVFVGDAKVSETAGSSSTQHRFLNYARWLARSGASLSSSVCAICYTDEQRTDTWRRFLALTLLTSGIKCYEIRSVRLDFPVMVLLAALRPQIYTG
jgi:hypothetical protein